jgi:hypothetical protein
MREIAALLSVLVLATGTGWYCYLIINRRVRPVLATWLIAGIAITISFAAYWGTPEHTWLGNITNLAGAIEIWFVITILSWVLLREGGLAVEFDRFQISCLVVSALILVGWKLTDQPALAFCLIQILIIIAYLATIGRLIKWRRNPDSSVMWGAILVASTFGLVPAIIDGDNFGIANSVRAILSSGFTFALMVRLDYVAQKCLKTA